MHTYRCGNTCGQKCCAKGSGKEVKIQEFVYRDTANVEPQMYDCTSNNWSHWNSNKKLKEKFGNCTEKTLNRFTTKDSYTWNITHKTESTAVWSLKPEWWRSPLAQEKYNNISYNTNNFCFTYWVFITYLFLILCSLSPDVINTSPNFSPSSLLFPPFSG